MTNYTCYMASAGVLNITRVLSPLRYLFRVLIFGLPNGRSVCWDYPQDLVDCMQISSIGD